jgi:radical SAM protein with 4Fe4S-binding SPASM domain
MGRPKRYSLAVELTPHCNQKCGYCYNDWRDEPGAVPAMPGPELYAMVERAVTEVEFDHVTLTGGEPFARAEIFDLLAMLERHGLRALIISNGGLITDAHAARLAPFRPLFVQVTLNGPERELHDAHVGKGHFDPTIRGIQALVREGVNAAGCIVVTRKNAGLVDRILDLFLSLGVKQVALSRYSPAGYAAEQIAELLPSRSDVMRALELAEPYARDRGMSLQVTMPVPPCVIDTSAYPSVVFSSCPIGTEAQEFALGSRGELRHCTLHTGSLGNGHESSFAEMVEAPAVTRYRDTTPEFCAPCPMKARCIGGCGAAAATVLGDPRGLDPFVGQHVDDALRARLHEARSGAGRLIPAGRLGRGPEAARS